MSEFEQYQSIPVIIRAREMFQGEHVIISSGSHYATGEEYLVEELTTVITDGVSEKRFIYYTLTDEEFEKLYEKIPEKENFETLETIQEVPKKKASKK